MHGHVWEATLSPRILWETQAAAARMPEMAEAMKAGNPIGHHVFALSAIKCPGSVSQVSPETLSGRPVADRRVTPAP